MVARYGGRRPAHEIRESRILSLQQKYSDVLKKSGLDNWEQMDDLDDGGEVPIMTFKSPFDDRKFVENLKN
tara:strand:+ start:1203 stop:1415 length:213 start_codon:yes stop_codon:yes gene_type:complete